MEKVFLHRFKEKEKEELQIIVENQHKYQPKAVKAAIHLLDKKFSVIIPQTVVTEQVQHKEKPGNAQTPLSSFDVGPYFRTFSYRDFLTGLSLSLLCNAYYVIINYYSNEPFFEDNRKSVIFFLTLLIFLANHVYYKSEHKKSNNFAGRVVSDFMLVNLIIGIKMAYYLILNINNEVTIDFSFSDLILGTISILIVACIFETVVALLKYLLIKVKCPIF